MKTVRVALRMAAARYHSPCLEMRSCVRGSFLKTLLLLTGFTCLYLTSTVLLAVWSCRDPSVAFRRSLLSSSSSPSSYWFSMDIHTHPAMEDSAVKSRWNFFGALSEIGSSVVHESTIVLKGIRKRTKAAVNSAASTAGKFISSFDPQKPVRSRPVPTRKSFPPRPPSPCECPSTATLIAELKKSLASSALKAPCPPATDPATQAQLEVLSARIDELTAQLIAVSKNQSSSEVDVLEEARYVAETAVSEESGKIWESMRKVEAQLLKVTGEKDELKEELTKVVRENVDVILRQVVAAFQQRPSNEASDVFSSPASDFAAWLRSELDHEAETRGLYLETKLIEYINSMFVSADEKKQKEKRVDLEMVTKIMKEQILFYDADKTGKPDFALESNGGTIVSTRYSEEYRSCFGEYYFFGIPLWWTKTSPRNAIQPRVSPGECWAFKGDQGYLVIQLANPIYVTGFTVEHIPKTISIIGEIKSAPKDFVVYGLNGELDPNPMELGSYTYSYDGEPVQYFPVNKHHDVPHAFVELKIQSNWGHPEYTCLYRIRVHGTRP